VERKCRGSAGRERKVIKVVPKSASDQFHRGARQFQQKLEIDAGVALMISVFRDEDRRRGSDGAVADGVDKAAKGRRMRRRPRPITAFWK
jgi:hypothetical protein